MRKKAIISLSGGMDSATLMASAMDQDREVVLAVGFEYGSKHNPYELTAARKVAKHYSVPFRLIDLSEAFKGFNSALMDDDEAVPEGYYEGENMRRTVVPGRNIIFASILGGLAWSLEAEEVFMGIHAGDHHIYPDCRPEFAIAMAGAIQAGTDGFVTMQVPFIRYHKEHILQRGIQLKVPYELTRTCYKNQAVACGKCGSCQERLDAFAKIGVEDPIEYETRELIPKSE